VAQGLLDGGGLLSARLSPVTAPTKTLVLRPRVQRVDECLRPTRAEVDLDAIAHNLRVVRCAVQPTKVLAVVKADAYGHGVVPVALRLEEEGVDGFGVALAEEGIELRDAGIESAIVVLNGVYGGAHEEVLAAGLTPVVYDLSELEAFARAAGGRPFAVHLKVDTGMSRLGVPWRELGGFLERLEGVRGLRVEGLMTHLAAADSDDELTALQLGRFADALAQLRAAGHRPTLLHAANSAAALRLPHARFDMVRVGIALFGLSSVPELQRSFRPAMRLRSEVIAVRELRPGDRVGYDGTFVAERPTKLATVPIGYGDGLMRANSNRGVALVRGVRCPLVGNVSMDLSTFDVSAAGEVTPGDEVVLLGGQPAYGDDTIGAAELAQASGTLPYEVWCAISRRVPRFYRGG